MAATSAKRSSNGGRAQGMFVEGAPCARSSWALQMSGGGTMLAFEVAGGKEAAFRMANALSIIGISNNLGDAKSLITHPERRPTSA